MPVGQVGTGGPQFILNTGSPHYVEFRDDIENFDIVAAGRKIRYNETFIEDGINVNFVKVCGAGQIEVRTYERGVEDETLSCGTGVVASALAAFLKTYGPAEKGKYMYTVLTRGGSLKVNFESKGCNAFNNIHLTGPEKRVFAGEIEI